MKRYTLNNDESAGADKLDYDAHLNPQQKAVVTAGSGPLLVIAGAGSGKTHTLTYRVAHLLGSGVAPDKILLLTFTNKAARSMTDRVVELVGSDVKRLWSGTFHSIGNRILRRYASRLGYPKEFTILDGEDAATLMKACLADSGADETTTRFPRGNVLARVFSYCINTQRTVEAVLWEHYPYFAKLHEPIREVFQLYQTRKLEMGLMDFDDLLLNWKRLLAEFPDLRDELAGRFEHVLIDEYQDTNHLQGEIIDLMASVHGNLMVVGDDCQSIYGFRGAEYTNILEFPTRYPGCKEFRLEINYRSRPEILELTNRSIAYNFNQFKKTLKSHREPIGFKPALVRLRDVYQQAAFTCQRVLELADEGVPLDEMAVLYRSHHHSMELQVEMTKRGIPYVVRSGVRFFEQAHIKDVLAYLRFMYNPKDELSFLRLSKHYRGIGTKRAQKIWMYASSQPDPLAAVSDAKLEDILPKRAAKSWGDASKLLGALRKGRLTSSPAELVDLICTGPYREYLKDNVENVDNRLGDLEQLAHYATQYGDLDRFLGEITLLSSLAGQDVVVGGEQPDEYVTLSSIHQAKGLEWAAVFVLWLSDGHFPSARSETNAEIEEERRLFYVATTRPRDELYLCHVFTHTGRDHRTTVLRESQFIDEMRGPDPEDDPWESWIIDQG